MSNTIKGYDIYQNGQFLGFIEGQNKLNRVRIARLLVSHTHMGEWIKSDKKTTYATTTGVYLDFYPCKRLADIIRNYSIDGLE